MVKLRGPVQLGDRNSVIVHWVDAMMCYNIGAHVSENGLEYLASAYALHWDIPVVSNVL